LHLHHDAEPGKCSELQSEHSNFDIPESVDLIENELESLSSFNFSCLFVENDGVHELEVEYEQEVEVKEVLVPSWEDEFVDELVDLPVCEEVEFDPLGDLKILEDLLFNQMPSVVMNQEPSEHEEEVHDEESSKPREKARKEPRERTRLQIGGWSTRMKKPLKCKHDQSSCYMPCIRFFPGKYKCW